MIPKKMSARNRTTGARQIPVYGPRGYCCAKGGNTSECQRFVGSLTEVHDLLRQGYSVRMSKTGTGRGNLRALQSIEVTF